jgi:cytochrome c oxidase assembly factor CtaG
VLVFEFLAAYAGLIFFLGGFLFAVPTIYVLYWNHRRGVAMPLLTTISFMLLLAFFSITWMALEMALPGHYFYLTVLSNAIGATIWGALVVQGLYARG